MFFREMARTFLAFLLHKLTTVKIGQRLCETRFAVWVCGKGPAIANLRYGAQAIVLVHEFVGRSMYLWGELDPRITAVMDAALREGDTVLDIGANFGVYGIFAAKRVGPTGIVYLFEPQPLVASCLRASLLINGYSNAIVHECALTDHGGSASMTVLDPFNLGRTRLLQSKSESSDISSTFEARTEDAGEYITSLGCEQVALVKLDVEGHEDVILTSMRDWLVEARPPVILFECHLDNRKFSEVESVRVLSGLGYELFGFDMKPIWQTRINPVSNTSHPIGSDFVAILWSALDNERRKALESLTVRRDSQTR